MPDSELFNGVESTNNSQAVYRTLAVRLVASTMHDYAKHSSRSHDAVIRVYDEAGNVIETHEHAGEFSEAS
jgi:RNase P protein component